MAAAVQDSEKDDSTFASAEYGEYDREFRRYTAENLRTAAPETDFASELLDNGESLRTKTQTLVELWRDASRVVIYTGAGVSTAAGLPDYRGPQGVWTRKLRGEASDDSMGMFELASLRPTLTHNAVARLLACGKVAAVVTTNVDGLHLAAGLPRESLSELHGNACVEECRGCGARYERGFVARTATGLFEHATGRRCEKCSQELYDNIVNFGNTFEDVPSMEAEHDRAWVECMKADLCVVLGSSLSVQTACDLPQECLEPRDSKPSGGKLVVVNRQRTPKDELAALRIFASCDEVMAVVESALLPVTTGLAIDGAACP